MHSSLLKPALLTEEIARLVNSARGGSRTNRGKNIIKQNRSQIQSQRAQNQQWDNAVQLNFQSRSENAGLYHALGEIQEVRLDDSFILEGGTQPNEDCRQKSLSMVKILHEELHWIPARIGASLEGGIMLVYRFPDEQTIEIEIENDLLISCVVSDKTAVLSSEVFTAAFQAYRFVKRTRATSPATVGV